MWYRLKSVVRLLQTLSLVAGLLWSSVCVAQCRIGVKKHSTSQSAKSPLPPCHQKQPSHGAPQNDCQDDGCLLANADSSETVVDAVVASLPKAASNTVQLLEPGREAAIRGGHARFAGRPPGSISILRV